MLRISRQPGYWICDVYVARALSIPSHIRIHEVQGFEISKPFSIQYTVVIISSLSLSLSLYEMSLMIASNLSRNMQQRHSSSYINKISCITAICHVTLLSYFQHDWYVSCRIFVRGHTKVKDEAVHQTMKKYEEEGTFKLVSRQP